MSLPKSSLSATSIGATIGFELREIATTVGIVGKETAGFDEIGGGAVTLVELGMSSAGAETLAVGVEFFIARVGALAFFPRLGFPLVLC